MQGSTKTGVVPEYTFLGNGNTYTADPPPGCGPVGQCFSESVVSDAVVTQQNVPGLNLDFTPEPGTWGLMLMGLAGLAMWRWRRRAVLPMLGVVAVCGAVPLRANSVSVTNFGPNGSQYPGIIVDGTTMPYCQQASSSSASCMTSFGGHGGGYGYIDAGGNISASAAFGMLRGGMTEDRSDGYLVASFGDNVVVTGGSGAGTLVAHYALVSEGAAQSPGSASYSFVQGGTRTSVNAAGNYVVNTGLPVTPPAPHCESIGFCFSESFDVSSPMQFGADLPLGAQMYVTSPSGTFFPPNGDVTATSSVDLTGYTVLDGAGNVVSDAVVTQQNAAGLDLFPAPEPGTWALMLVGLGIVGMWRWRRRKVLLPLMGLVAATGVTPVWANSVYVSNTSFPPQISGPPPTGTFQCQQSGSVSAGCSTNYAAFYGLVTGEGFSGGTAAFGMLTGQMQESGGSSGYLAASFDDRVTVTGGSGAATLVAHYALTAAGNAVLVDSAKTAGFSFVQGATSASVTPAFVNYGYTTANLNPAPGCGNFGLCFSETFDVSSPVTFGTALPLTGAIYSMSDGFGELPVGLGGGLNVATNLTLTGFTVLDAGGHVVGDAVVTPQNSPGLPLFPAPEPGTWAMMLAGVAVLMMWRLRRRGLMFSLMGLVAASGAVPLFGDSVFVSNSSALGLPAGYAGPPVTIVGTQIPYCEQAGASSANCGTSTQAYASGRGYFGGAGSSSATAAFGALYGQVLESEPSSGYFVASFGDNVIVSGGTGNGTLISHYTLADTGEAVGGGAGTLGFVQGSTKSSVTATNFINLGFPPSAPAIPPGCQGAGVCFSESFDVNSPIQFGEALPLGAQTYLNSEDFRDQFSDGVEHVEADSTVKLTGYTVLDAAGNVVADAQVTRQNVAGLDLFPTPEPGTWGLMLAGAGLLGAWRLRLYRRG